MSEERTRRRMVSLATERERRQKAKFAAAGGDPRDWLIARLTEMASRLAAAPDYVPPTPDENAAIERELDEFLSSADRS